MNDEKLTEVLPMTRVPSSLRARLDRIVAASVSPRASDHIRYAIERYVESEEVRRCLPPVNSPVNSAAAGQPQPQAG